jgi:hypothetical protein
MCRAIAIFLSALAALACAAEPAAARHSHCHGRRGYQAVATNGRVVYFEATTGPYAPDIVCYVRTGRRTPLEPVPVRLRMAGDHVAYEWEGGEGPDGYVGVDLVNARTGRESVLDIEEGATVGYFKKIVLKPNGATAWSTRHVVHACRRPCLRTLGEDVARHDVTLAHGPRVNGKWLTAIARGIAWREGGRWRRARLGPR